MKQKRRSKRFKVWETLDLPLSALKMEERTSQGVQAASRRVEPLANSQQGNGDLSPNCMELIVPTIWMNLEADSSPELP